MGAHVADVSGLVLGAASADSRRPARKRSWSWRKGARPSRSSRATGRKRPAASTRSRSAPSSTRRRRGTRSSSGRRSSSRRSRRQGKLTPELKARLLATFDLATLEDLYLPYKKKRKTKAVIAREAGLQPLADWLWDVRARAGRSPPARRPRRKAAAFLDAEAGFADAAAALAGRRRDPRRAALGDRGAAAGRAARGVRARGASRREGREGRRRRASSRCTSTSASRSPR